MIVLRPLCLFILAGSIVLPQEIRIGVQGGERFGDFFLQGGYRGHFGIADYTSKPVPYTLGPIGEIGLPFRLSFESSALYQRFHYSYSGRSVSGIITNFAAKTTGDAWSFPAHLKWRPLRRHPVFFVGGPVMRHLSGLHQVVNYRKSGLVIPDPIGTSSTTDPTDLRKRWYPGLELGGGWHFQFSRVLISPEIRYTRWTANAAEDRVNRILQFPPNQIGLLVGITYKVF